MVLLQIKKTLNKTSPEKAIGYAQFLIELSSGLGISTIENCEIDQGKLQLRILSLASTFLNRTASLVENEGENEESINCLLDSLEGIELEIQDAMEVACLVDAIVTVPQEDMRSKPVIKYKMRF